MHLITKPSHQQLHIALDKVAACTLHWRNQQNNIFAKFKPKTETYNGSPVDPSDRALEIEDRGLPNEPLVERLKRFSKLDKWTPVCTIIMCNGHKERKEGNDALRFWYMWKGKR